MPTNVTYYAIVTSSVAGTAQGESSAVADDEGQADQAFTRELKWEHTPLLYSYERGNMDNKLYEISEAEADQIVERIRRTVADRE